jgi:hypothetical protein
MAVLAGNVCAYGIAGVIHKVMTAGVRLAAQRLAVVIADPVAIVVHDLAQAVRPAEVVLGDQRDKGLDVVGVVEVVVVEVEDDVFIHNEGGKSKNRSHAITATAISVR